ncbi:MAG TPA: hypothetical protein DER09_02300 [Prolixibacteraceae bacterium]|nr:hypothetical protein [Prolixibacteraceae bacterium]
MKTLFSVLFLAFAFVLQLQVNAQSADSTLIIKFASTVHDYGTIEKGSDGSCNFVFTNTGQTPLVLSNVRASCGCTVPTWPREPVLPGKDGTIKVVYNTNLIGSFNKSISVNSNAKNKEVILNIKGSVIQKKQ